MKSPIRIAVPIFICLATASIGAQETVKAKYNTRGWDQTDERKCARLIYFDETAPTPWDSSPGQVAIEYGMPLWKAEYAEQFDLLTKGRRWRLGQNLWTNLDTRFSIRIGDLEIQPGYYYLVLERSEKGDWSLVVLDPDELVGKRLDAWHVDKKTTPPGRMASLTWQKSDEIADKLSIAFKLDEKNIHKAVLELRFGSHQLSTDVEVIF